MNKCQKCVEQGKTSRLYMDGYGSSTAMYCQPFYDEEGKYHNHDLNSFSHGGHCSNGHNFYIIASTKCHCGWGSDEQIKWLSDSDPISPTTISITGDATISSSEIAIQYHETPQTLQGD